MYSKDRISLSIDDVSLLRNITCKEASYWSDPNPSYSLSDISTLLLFTTLHLSSLIMNILWALVLLHRAYGPHLSSTTKKLLLACSMHGIAHGTLVLFTSLYTVLTKCWPFGSFTCKFQAMVFGGLGHHYVCLIIIIALDRFWSVHPREYVYRFIVDNHITTCMAILLFFASFGLYWYLVFFLHNYKVSTNSLQICEAVHNSERIQIIGLCVQYFMPTLVLMYCYGYIFHQRQREKTNNRQKNGKCDMGDAEKRRYNYKLSGVTASMFLIFNILITPNTLKEVFIMIGGSQPSTPTSLFISWCVGSYYLFNPLANLILDPHFRRVSAALILEDILCRRSADIIPCCSNGNFNLAHQLMESSDAQGSCTTTATIQQGSSDSNKQFTPQIAITLPFQNPRGAKKSKPCFIDHGEKYWGEILEKSLSFRNLHDGNSILETHPGIVKPQSISLNNIYAT